MDDKDKKDYDFWIVNPEDPEEEWITIRVRKGEKLYSDSPSSRCAAVITAIATKRKL